MIALSGQSPFCMLLPVPDYPELVLLSEQCRNIEDAMEIFAKAHRYLVVNVSVLFLAHHFQIYS